MIIESERQGNVLVVILNGRLDGFGSQILEKVLKNEVKDDCEGIVLDMTAVPYLSSAGIRIFVWMKKLMKDRNGGVALFGIREFPKSVLEMGGFVKIIPLFETRREAVDSLQRKAGGFSLLEKLGPQKTETEKARYTLHPSSSAPAVLEVTGSLEKLLLSRLNREDIRELSFSSTDYSLGLGAIGGELDDAYSLLGEMITLHGSVVFVPTDGNYTPDFFTPLRDTGKVKIFSGFSISLQGPFHMALSIEAPDEQGISLKDLYQDIFSFAKQHVKGFSGVVAMTMYAIAAGVCSSEITHSPVIENAPPNRGSIMDPENYEEWNYAVTNPRFAGDTLVSFGIGVDLTADLMAFPQKTLDSLFYIHPANRAGRDLYLHNHGVVFSGIPWHTPTDINTTVRRIVTDGTFIDMRHLLDETRVKKAFCGVSCISKIEVKP